MLQPIPCAQCPTWLPPCSEKCFRNKTHHLLCGLRDPLIPMNVHCLLHAVALSPLLPGLCWIQYSPISGLVALGLQDTRLAGEDTMFAAPKLIWSWKTTGSAGKGRTEGEAKDREVLVALWSGREGTAHSNSGPPQQPFFWAFPIPVLPADVSVPWATSPGCF